MPENSAIVPYSGAGNPVYDAQSALAKSIFEATKSVSCPLYRDYPGFMTGSSFGSPYATATDSILNELCAPTGNLPAPPTSRFNGGQCVCVLYNVDYSFTTAEGATGSSGVTMSGPVRSVQVESTPPSPNGDPKVGIVTRGGSAACGGFRVSTDLAGSNPGLKILGVTVTRNDSQPDLCGNPAPTYPIAPPPDSALNVNVPIQISPNFNVTVPVAVFAPITILRPSLRLGDFNVDFNLGGLTISPAININTGGGNANGGNPPQPPAGETPNDRDDDELLKRILRYLERLRRCQDCDLDYDFLFTSPVAGRSGSLTVPSGGVPLTAGISITQSPTNRREQNGLTQPGVLYAGWGWWEGNGFLSERFPVDADMKLFHTPVNPRAQIFRFTLYEGFAGQATMAYKRLKSPLPPV